MGLPVCVCWLYAEVWSHWIGFRPHKAGYWSRLGRLLFSLGRFVVSLDRLPASLDRFHCTMHTVLIIIPAVSIQNYYQCTCTLIFAMQEYLESSVVLAAVICSHNYSTTRVFAVNSETWQYHRPSTRVQWFNGRPEAV